MISGCRRHGDSLTASAAVHMAVRLCRLLLLPPTYALRCWRLLTLLPRRMHVLHDHVGCLHPVQSCSASSAGSRWSACRTTAQQRPSLHRRPPPCPQIVHSSYWLSSFPRGAVRPVVRWLSPLTLLTIMVLLTTSNSHSPPAWRRDSSTSCHLSA